MPLYEYECEAGHRFEVIQRFSDPPRDRCPTCGAPARKLQSAPAFHLKGSGWYITDYARKDADARSGEKAGDKGGDTPGEKKAESSGGSKTESKAEGKSESTAATKAPAASPATAPAGKPSDAKTP